LITSRRVEAPPAGAGCVASGFGNVAATVMINGTRETALNPRRVMAGSGLVSAVITISFAAVSKMLPDS
jgi:hypothetical protein